MNLCVEIIENSPIFNWQAGRLTQTRWFFSHQLLVCNQAVVVNLWESGFLSQTTLCEFSHELWEASTGNQRRLELSKQSGSATRWLLCHPFMKSLLHRVALVHFHCWLWQEIMWFPAKTSKPTPTPRVKICSDNTLLHKRRSKPNTANTHVVKSHVTWSSFKSQRK